MVLLLKMKCHLLEFIRPIIDPKFHLFWNHLTEDETLFKRLYPWQSNLRLNYDVDNVIIH